MHSQNVGNHASRPEKQHYAKPLDLPDTHAAPASACAHCWAWLLHLPSLRNTHYDPLNRSFSMLQPLITLQNSKGGMEKLSTEYRKIPNLGNICSCVLHKFAITENLAHRFSLSYTVPQPDNNLRNEFRCSFALCDLWDWNELHFPHHCSLWNQKCSDMNTNTSITVLSQDFQFLEIKKPF
jgi:hypothetical protein